MLKFLSSQYKIYKRRFLYYLDNIKFDKEYKKIVNNKDGYVIKIYEFHNLFKRNFKIRSFKYYKNLNDLVSDLNLELCVLNEKIDIEKSSIILNNLFTKLRWPKKLSITLVIMILSSYII